MDDWVSKLKKLLILKIFEILFNNGGNYLDSSCLVLFYFGLIMVIIN